MLILLKALGDLFFPQLCYGCGSDLVDKNQQLCLKCRDEIPFTNFAGKKDNPVEKIFWGRMPVESAASLVYFSKQTIIAHLLHHLKYKGKKGVGEMCGRMMGEMLIASGLIDMIDVLIPLPLFRKKEKIRGYNQATLICNGMSSITNKPVVEDAVARISFTETQTRKGRIARWENMQERFVVSDESKLEDKHVLLVDDVITTGATLEACGTNILKAKNTRLSIFTFAYSFSRG